MILDEILKKTKEDLILREKERSFKDLEGIEDTLDRVLIDPKPNLISTKEDPIKIIAEVKKASPSKGIIRKDFNPLNIAKEYEVNGANAISILTEPHYFKGDINYLKLIKEHSNLPLLRKDFIFTKYQILEAFIFGADFILLIVSILNSSLLKDLIVYAKKLKLEVLVEIHNKEELQIALDLGVDIIGINHRDLKTFNINTNLSYELLPFIPKNKIIISESGLCKKEELLSLHKAGIDAFLIGEFFMRQDDIAKCIRTFKFY